MMLTSTPVVPSILRMSSPSTTDASGFVSRWHAVRPKRALLCNSVRREQEPNIGGHSSRTHPCGATELLPCYRIGSRNVTGADFTVLPQTRGASSESALRQLAEIRYSFGTSVQS